jgi:hypothetical protein
LVGEKQVDKVPPRTYTVQLIKETESERCGPGKDVLTQVMGD